ncbi:hypothetical protein N8I77_011447 [Diaporthe amygdali]|uniref:Heterokaryon incompatibility domain-containing protein n=1 Tax=Phomopsis amygdali TaxID=1214568 RepID=A0AAD9S6S4_PHOAM|nr:hypothetical protein N8I77_011447 [Diaporthe amygdali]
MFHIYRKASSVLVWLGSAGPGTCLGTDILNIYDTFWQDDRQYDFVIAMRHLLERRKYSGIYVDDIINDLGDSRLSDDERADADTLGRLSLALGGIADLWGRAWVRRTWIIQEIAAASNVKFHCGRSVISYDAFFHVAPHVGRMIWHTRSVLLAGQEDPTVLERFKEARHTDILEMFGRRIHVGDDGPALFRESSPFIQILHELRLLVHDPTRRVQARCTQTELLLVFLVETVSRGFEVSIAADRVYSLTAMADAISSASWGLTFNKRTASSPQQLPVDYSVGFQAAVLRALKIRMNEVGHFYVTIQRLSSFIGGNETYSGTEDRGTKLDLFSMCNADSSPPSWLKLLEFNEGQMDRYIDRVGSSQKARHLRRKFWRWAEQDVTEPDTLKLRGKALGRLVVDSKGHPSRTWVALPCPLGQEFETCSKWQKPVRALHEGCPDERPTAADGAGLDDAEIGDERNEPIEQRMAPDQIQTDNDDDFQDFEVDFWNWQFPLGARDGDVVVVFVGTCALIRPSHGGRYKFVKEGLRVPVDFSKKLTDDHEEEFLFNHRENLDTFVLI